MKIIPADGLAVQKAADLLREGGVVVFPTETVYGLGALWGKIPASEQLRRIKGRDADKPFQLLIPSTEHAGIFAEVSEPARAIMERFFPGPLTLVLPDGRGGTVGLRMPDHPWLLALLKKLDTAIVATSANRSGEPPAINAQEAAAALGSDVPLMIDGGASAQGAASTVASLQGGEVHILRVGAISAETLQQVVQSCPTDSLQ